MEKTGKFLRIGGLVAVIVFILALIMFNVTASTPASDKVWDMRTTIGSPDAKNLFIMYTDIACPYCSAFERAIMTNEDEFKDYIAKNDILVEIRVMDFLYYYGEHPVEMSKLSAEATTCATEKDKFWDYYHAALQALWNDYQSKGIGISKTSPAITDTTKDYWLDIGEKAGLNREELSSCMDKPETEKKLQGMVEKTAKSGATGMPYFVEGSFKTSGFDSSWGWDEVREYLGAGLKK